MTERCEDLDLFYDRELGVEAEQEFRDHLAHCARCDELLLGRMLETAVVFNERQSRPSLDPLPADLIDRSGGADEPIAASVEEPAPPPRPEPRSTREAEEDDGGALAAQALTQAKEQAQAGTPVDGVPIIDLSAVRRRRLALVAGVALSIAAAFAFVLWPGHRGHQDAAAIALAATRSVDARFSAAPFDRHRDPAPVMRAADSAAPAAWAEKIDRQAIVGYETGGRLHEALAANALNGDLVAAQRAAALLSKPQPGLPNGSAASLSDRAALQLLDARAGAGVTTSSPRTGALERALSLTTEALRIDPLHSQARWNKALALNELGLTLVAAQAFDQIAARGEPGWATEAARRAAEIRAARDRKEADWSALAARAEQMATGGPPLDDVDVGHAPGVARDQLYLALATAATPERLATLGEFARRLDAQFSTTAMTAAVDRVRRSNLARRAPVAAEFRTFIAERRPFKEINALRSHALAAAAPDIALASFLVIADDKTDHGDIALLDQLLADNRDEWWTVIAMARRAFVAEFWDRDYAAVDAIALRAEALCKDDRRGQRPSGCRRLALHAGGASSQTGRTDLALAQLTRELRDARRGGSPLDELAALDALGQALALRVVDGIDAAALNAAYMEEVELRGPGCWPSLYKLDFAANGALRYHRFHEAARYRSEADELEHGSCRTFPPRLNGETARLQLLLARPADRAQLAALRAAVARLVERRQVNQALYLNLLSAAADLVEDRARGEAALHAVIATADAKPDATYANLTRAIAFDALVDSVAARGGSAAEVLALLTERLAAPSHDRCVVGVAAWNRLIVAALGADGTPVLEARDIPPGEVAIPAEAVVSASIRAQLAGCARIDVLAPGAYLGAAGLLGDDVAWAYRTGTPKPAAAAVAHRELVVSDVAPPEELHLPALRSFAGGDGAAVLSGASATPTSVLAAMQTASLAIVVAHGVTDAEVPSAASLALSPDAHGDYLLTALKVRSVKLTAAPIVVLAGCDAGRVQLSTDPWSLATSFLAAGARVVIAPTAPIPDAGADEVFRSLLDRIRGGAAPVDALLAERKAHAGNAPWLSSIVVFE